MASRELDILVRAKGALGAARDIGKVDSAVGRLSSNARRGVRNASANLARIGVIAAGAVASQVALGIRSLEELERATNATAGVIESTGGKAGVTAEQVRALAESLEAVTTADDKVIQSGENLLLTFTNIGKDVFPQATKAMVDLGIAMAQGDVANADFKSSAIQIGKALNDPIRGITALRRVGVSFTKQQETQIKNFVEAGDIMSAQKIILRELETEFGKAGEAAGKGFGADMRRFQDAVEGAQQALAIGFLPLISEVTTMLNQELAKPETLARIKEFGQGLVGGVRSLIGIAKNIPWAQVGDAFKLMGQGAKAALDLFVSMPPWVQTAVLTGWGLNKLTGGALGSIVGELGKGLIRGVLGMNAGVVNINAGVVNGGGVPGVGGKGGVVGGTGGGILGKLLVLTGLGALLGYEIDRLAQINKGLRAENPIKRVGNFSTKGQSGGMSPDERQEANETQRKLTDLRVKTAETKMAVASGSNAIVAAIRGIDLNVTIPVSIRTGSGTITRIVRVVSGSTISRYSGKLVPID